MLGSSVVRLHGVGQLLVIEKLLEKELAIEYYQQATAEKISMINYLVKNNILSALQIATTIAHHLDIPFMDMNDIKLDSIPIALVNKQLLAEHSMMPLYFKETNLYVATDDPTQYHSLKEIQFHTGLNIQPIVVETDKLARLIEQILTIKDNQCLSEYANELSDDEELIIHEEDEPTVKFVNKIFLDAIKQGASDIHFEPFDKAYRIRYRQDGILHEITTPPANLAARITARIKVMAHLDSSERRVPQDGAFKMNGSIDFRVSTCPTTSGEKVVIRILDPHNVTLGIEALGFSSKQKEYVTHALDSPQGMILVTGPTGSGKTVSLYTALNRLNTKEVNIITAEDPVEIKVAGINQVNINPKVGLTFSNALRAFLRQDPDIIMVGEIRDLETAEIAVKAAQTGHLVLSTLHTNSAAETLTRLVNMGIPTFNIASSVTLIIAQRLARKLCDHCKIIREDVIPDFEEIKLYKAVGCPQCTQGYRGRIGLFEVLPMSKSLGELIMSGANSLAILKMAQAEGMLSIYQSGLEKIKQGITTIEEINRVTVD